MNLMVVFGTLICVMAMFLGVPELRTNLATYTDPFSFILVMGGTIGCTVIATSFSDFKSVIGILSGWMYFKKKKISFEQTIEKMVELSEKAHRTGKASILDLGKNFDDGFLDRALRMMGAGLDREFVSTALETDIDEMQKRHYKFINVISSMGNFAPMFGMMGTVMGVMLVLQNITDIDSVVSGMALALLTTMYGLILSSVIFIPISYKLKSLSTQDALVKEIIMKGILAIMDDLIPLKVEKLLMAYVSEEGKAKKAKKK